MADAIFKDTIDSEFFDTADIQWYKELIRIAGGIRTFRVDTERRIFLVD